MYFPQANQRRRRVLADDLASADDAAIRPSAAPPPRTHRRIDGYAPAAKPGQQRRVADLIPTRPLSFGLWFAAGLVAIGGLAAGQIWRSWIAGQISAQATVSLELGVRGSLGGWVASLWLAVAAALSMLIYSIRRHKLDDYRGRYRWWLIAAAACWTMSIDASCGIHDLFAATMVRLTGYAGPGGGAAWWLACAGLVFVGLSIRIGWEMRVCRPALACALAALTLWGTGLVIGMCGLRLGTLGTVLPAEVAKLLGHLSLLLGLGLYARHVNLHAQGLLPAPTRKRRAMKDNAKRGAKTAAAASPDAPAKIAASEDNPRTDLRPHFSASALRSPQPAAKSDSSQDDESTSEASDYESEEEPDDSAGEQGGHQDRNSNRKLSKAERKRLRKLKAQEEQGW